MRTFAYFFTILCWANVIEDIDLCSTDVEESEAEEVGFHKPVFNYFDLYILNFDIY